MTEPRTGVSWKSLLFITGGVLVYIWDDIFFAAPIVAVASSTSPVTAWVIGSVAFSVGSYLISLWVIRNFNSPNDKIVGFITKSSDRVHGNFGKGLLSSVGVMSFIVSSIFAGGILTTFFLMKGGFTDNIRQKSLWSCIIFGVAFSAQYAGLVAIGRALL